MGTRFPPLCRRHNTRLNQEEMGFSRQSESRGAGRLPSNSQRVGARRGPAGAAAAMRGGAEERSTAQSAPRRPAPGAQGQCCCMLLRSLAFFSFLLSFYGS